MLVISWDGVYGLCFIRHTANCSILLSGIGGEEGGIILQNLTNKASMRNMYKSGAIGMTCYVLVPDSESRMGSDLQSVMYCVSFVITVLYANLDKQPGS